MSSHLPPAIARVVDAFAALPSIGPKTAQRLAFYLLRSKQSTLDQFADAVRTLRTQTLFCHICHVIAEGDPCAICTSPQRDQETLCVVEDVLDELAIESTQHFNGKYHVLGGVISPLDGVAPEDLSIAHLQSRIQGKQRINGVPEQITEVILAMNPTTEGEATALYIAKLLQKTRADMAIADSVLPLKITRIARGLPTGSDMEYADQFTLTQAMAGRRELV